MKPLVTARASEKLRAQYRALLLEEWTRLTLEQVLSLLWEEIRASAERVKESWVASLQPRPGQSSGLELNDAVVQRIRSFSEFLASPGLPPMPTQFPARKQGKLPAQAERSWTFLTLEGLANLAGDVGLFRDTQSVLFLTALNYLLPSLQDQGWQAEHDCLLHAMDAHLWLAWRDQPSHLYYLSSQMMAYLEQRELRDRLLLASFRLTPPEDHAFLTKAQQYWSNLMEEGRQKEAIKFLFSLRHQALPSHQEEIEAMIDYTMENRQEQPA
jgi:hypothetical protein